jgi:ferrous iron transport protein A
MPDATLPPAAADPAEFALDHLLPGHAAVVMRLHGDAGTCRQLAASGLWAGAPIECMQRAPFGDPLLYRVHGYRLALRATEAAMVMVREVAR